MSSTTSSKLFSPIQVGRVQLSHRVVLAPLTRKRASADHVLGDMGVTYYEQRASTPGSLLITEATLIAAEAGGIMNTPGIWNQEQIESWKRITDAVHAKGSFIFLQIWGLGRAADPTLLKKEGDFPYVSSSNVPLTGNEDTPRALTRDEITKYIGLFSEAAKNAIEAGFDGVELHGANGYLIDQFIQDIANTRTDEYGGSIENRARFLLEVTKVVTDAIGQDRTGVRLSPWSTFQDMREKNPIPTFSYIIEQLRDRFPQLAYLHMIEPGIRGNEVGVLRAEESNDFARKIWGERPLIAAGGFTAESAKATVEEKGGLIAFGRHFISNPDLPKRLQSGASLTPYDRPSFYTLEDPKGYIDYQSFEEQDGSESSTKSRTA